MTEIKDKLPVDSIVAELCEALELQRTAVLQAPPGSGKTTRVPLALLNESWLHNQKILMLEPRRLAATNAARYMAKCRNETVGESIGYTIRYERKTSSRTRLDIMTEGVLIRRLQNDPELKDVGLVVFDEFHERSLHADLALALCRDIQEGLREDLKILVMSATLNAEPLAHLLGNCPIITASGRSFPVAVEHFVEADKFKIAEATSQGIRHALKETKGDILAFLPGAGEIRTCKKMLDDLAGQIDLRPLYGNLPFSDQEAAILPGKKRRVVLSTNVAETSLTIEGIESVVDSGWERRPRFDAARGLTRLEMVRISNASAEQRAGRAGRLGPGRCFRLWTMGTQGALLPFAPPEIRQADLAPLAFELAQWGALDPVDLAWMDPPPEGHLIAAKQLLVTLGALDKDCFPTALGQRMALYPAHPRLARLLVASIDEGCPELGSNLTAILSERDLLMEARQSAKTVSSSDLLDRLELLQRDHSPRTAAVRKSASFWKKLTKAGHESTACPETIGQLLATAYPDRIGRQRKAGSRRYLLRNGQGVVLAPNSVVKDAEWLVAVETVGRTHGEDEIRLASALSHDLIEEMFGHSLEWQRESGWDESSNRVFAREVRRLGAIILQERQVAVNSMDTTPALLDLIRQQGLEVLPWSRDTRQLQARAAFVFRNSAEEDWGDWSNNALLEELSDWLPNFLNGIKSRNDLKKIDLSTALKSRLGWNKLKKLDRLAPERLEVPSGSKIRIDYSTEDLPVLAVKLQELFGLGETPRLISDRVPVVIHLLSPANRALAITKDLKSFWDTVYPDVQKEMKGRYPKHPWPDDPWNAVATKRTKRK